MKLSIVIINYNSGRYLTECVGSIYENLVIPISVDRDHIDSEILVIDNNSQDDSLILLNRSHPNVRVLMNGANLGFVMGANQGIANTGGEYILLLNPDVRLLDKNISSMIAFLDRDLSIGICGPLLVREDGSSQSGPSRFNGIFSELKFISGAYLLNKLSVKKKFLNPIECDYIPGSCMLIRRSLLEDIGIFDENIFIFAEEEEICFRAKRKGWKIFFYPPCKVIHYGGVSFEGLERERIVNQRMSALYYYSKRYNIFCMVLLRLIFLISAFIRIIVLGLRMTLRPRTVANSLRRLNGNFKAVVLILKMKDSRSLNAAEKTMV